MPRTSFAAARKSIVDRLEPDHACGWLSAALPLCTSGQLKAGGPGVLLVRNWFPAVDEEDYAPIDFREFYTPPSRVLTSRTLADREDLCVATTLAIDTYLTRAAASKSSHTTADMIAKTLAKFWEWGFLHDIYRPADWTRAHLQALWDELRVGGWPHALRLVERTEALLRSGIHAEQFLDAEHQRDGRPSLRQKVFREHLRINLAHRTLALARATLLNHVGKPEPLPEHPIYSESTYSSLLQHIQYLSSPPPPYGLTFAVDLVPGVRASKFALGGRTKNLDVETAATLLEGCCKWIYEFAPLILEWHQASIASAIALASIGKTLRGGNQIGDYLEALPQKADLEKALGLKIHIRRGVGRNKVMYGHVIGMLMTACFVAIGMMNARRRGEISHKHLGLKKDSIRVESKELGVYQADFYIEKSLKSYAPFYVNKLTYDAFKVLDEFNELQRLAEDALDMPQTDPERASLFWMRTFSMRTGLTTTRVWFEYHAGVTGVCHRFFRWAIGGSGGDVHFPAHSFRRLYALLFIYRFEHGTLQALAHQLKHFNVAMTQRYVTDALITATRKRIPVALLKHPDQVRQAVLDQQSTLEEAVSVVAREKLDESLQRILQGWQEYSGGFPGLVRRLHKKLSLQVDYARLDAERQAKRVSDILTRKGHQLEAFGHGDCVAGAATKPRTARCHDPVTGVPEKYKASAPLCASCPYHLVSRGYLEAQRHDLSEMRNELQAATEGSLLAAALAREMVLLEQAIQFHAVRIEATQL